MIRVTEGDPDDEPMFAPGDKKRNEEVLFGQVSKLRGKHCFGQLSYDSVDSTTSFLDLPFLIRFDPRFFFVFVRSPCRSWLEDAT